MENTEIHYCQLKKTHLICKDLIEIPCNNKNKPKVACYECILQHVNYNGIYRCNNCKSDHKFNFKGRIFEQTHQNISKEVCLDEIKIKDISEDLLSLSSRSIAKLEGIFYSTSQNKVIHFSKQNQNKIKT